MEVKNKWVGILEPHAKNPHSEQRGSLSATPLMKHIWLSHRMEALGIMLLK